MGKKRFNEPLTVSEQQLIDKMTGLLVKEETGLFNKKIHLFIKAPHPVVLQSYYVSKSALKDLEDKGALVSFNRAEVGALFKYEERGYKAHVTVEYLLNIPSRRPMSNAQMVELEYLLNKAGKSLNLNLSPVPEATENDMKDILFEILLDHVQRNTIHFFGDMQEEISYHGFSSKIKKDEFLALATKFLT